MLKRLAPCQITDHVDLSMKVCERLRSFHSSSHAAHTNHHPLSDSPTSRATPTLPQAGQAGHACATDWRSVARRPPRAAALRFRFRRSPPAWGMSISLWFTCRSRPIA